MSRGLLLIFAVLAALSSIALFIYSFLLQIAQTSGYSAQRGSALMGFIAVVCVVIALLPRR